MNSAILKLQIGLLILQHGEAAVTKSLAYEIGLSENELSSKIMELREAQKNRIKKQKPKKTMIEVAELVIGDSSNKTGLIKLATLYQNKRFLPQLKDVKKFLRDSGVSKEPKSRTEAVKAVFDILITLTSSEITNLHTEPTGGERSDFSLLAENIIDGSK